VLAGHADGLGNTGALHVLEAQELGTQVGVACRCHRDLVRHGSLFLAQPPRQQKHLRHRWRRPWGRGRQPGRCVSPLPCPFWWRCCWAPAARWPATRRSPRPRAPSSTARTRARAYDKALESFLDRDWEEARNLLQEVRRKYAYSQYARLAEQRLSDIDYEQEKFAAAITGYRAYVTDHPADEGVPYARFRICKALYAQVSDTILLPPQEERDQAAIVDAYRELGAFLADYPQSKWTKDAQFMLVTVTGRLVRHELYVARYYLNRDRFEPAAKRIQYALARYDGSGLEPEALVMLAETYMKMKKTEEAKNELRRVLEFYPASPFVVPARGPSSRRWARRCRSRPTPRRPRPRIPPRRTPRPPPRPCFDPGLTVRRGGGVACPIVLLFVSQGEGWV
jgi:outer membrane protein assembly factor BamD